jgi:hypothetical protein
MSEQAPSKQEWAALYQASVAFRDAAPWEWMYDSDMFGVANPAGGLAWSDQWLAPAPIEQEITVVPQVDEPRIQRIKQSTGTRQASGRPISSTRPRLSRSVKASARIFHTCSCGSIVDRR